MPRVYRKKTYKKRAPVKRRYRGRRRRTDYKQKQIASLGVGFPKMLKVTHKYHDIINVISNTGIVASQLFRCNGMYDPDYTNTGHQPIMFDEMCALYNHYTVIGAKIKVRFAASTTATQPSMVGIYVDDDLSTVTSITNVIEQGNTKYTTTAYDGSPKQLTYNWSAKKAFGGNILNNSLLRGNGGGSPSDPTEQQFFRLFVRPMDGASTTGIWADVQIEYIVIWDELKTLIGS